MYDYMLHRVRWILLSQEKFHVQNQVFACNKVALIKWKHTQYYLRYMPMLYATFL